MAFQKGGTTEQTLADYAGALGFSTLEVLRVGKGTKYMTSGTVKGTFTTEIFGDSIYVTVSMAGTTYIPLELIPQVTDVMESLFNIQPQVSMPGWTPTFSFTTTPQYNRQLFNEQENGDLSLMSQIISKLLKLKTYNPGKKILIDVTGHSRGGALADIIRMIIIDWKNPDGTFAFPNVNFIGISAPLGINNFNSSVTNNVSKFVLLRCPSSLSINIGARTDPVFGAPTNGFGLLLPSFSQSSALNLNDETTSQGIAKNIVVYRPNQTAADLLLGAFGHLMPFMSCACSDIKSEISDSGAIWNK